MEACQEMETKSNTNQYVTQLLNLYRHTPGTLGRVRREDRRLALDLQKRGIPLSTLEQAFLLAAARRSLRDPNAPLLSPVRSLHYFVPVIEELMATPLPDDYLEYLKHKMRKIQADHETALLADRSRRQKPR
jgi:hypothetical protein